MKELTRSSSACGRLPRPELRREKRLALQFGDVFVVPHRALDEVNEVCLREPKLFRHLTYQRIANLFRAMGDVRRNTAVLALVLEHEVDVTPNCAFEALRREGAFDVPYFEDHSGE